MNRLGKLIRRTRGALVSRALGSLAGLLLTTVAQAAIIPWSNNQTQECTIGASDGTSGTTDRRFNCTDAVAIDATNRKFYATDRQNHRVLRFAYPATSNEPAAEAVFGQANFTSGSANRGGPIAANTLNEPYGLAVAANGDLWISDKGNNRVLKIPSAYNAISGTAATRVLGQADFGSGTEGLAASRLNHPSGLSIDTSGNLWVADTSNNRVLRFANIAAAGNGDTAVQVLGQPDFTSNAVPSTAVANRLNGPYAVCAAGSVLWVAEYSNNRVVRYNNPLTKGLDAAADGVLGQVNLNSNTANRGGSVEANTLNGPGGITADTSGTLYVSDSSNYRVLIFPNAASLPNGAAASNWLNNLGTVWALAYDSTYHRLLVPRASNSSINQYANLSTTTASLTSNKSPSFPGASVTFTATVTASTGTPTGTVQFIENGNVLGTGTLNASGVATFATSTLALGSHTITAKYLGDATNQISLSASLTQEIALNAPGFTLVSSASSARQSTAVTFTATLAPANGVATRPTGTVAFSVDGTAQATVSLDSNGVATWSTSSLALGTHIIAAAYSGDTLYQPRNTSIPQFIEPIGIRTLSAVANIERDTKGTETIVYDGSAFSSVIYTGAYDGFRMWAAFRFNVSAVPATFVKAELKVHISFKSDNTATYALELHGSNDDAWSDTTVPPTAPAAIIANALDSRAANTFTSGAWLTFDVTDFVRTQVGGDKAASFVFTMPAAPTPEWYIGIDSRENAEYPPVLQILEQYTYVNWAETSFTAAELANPAISGATADPDSAGVTNLVRYACGLPARGPVAAPGTATFNTGTNPATATFSFPMRASAGDLLYEVQTSPDLATWTTAETYRTTGTARTVAAPVAAPTGAKRFFVRLKISTVL